MLKGAALEYFYGLIDDSDYSLKKVVETMRNYFETDGTKTKYLSHWRYTTLASISEEYPEKKI